MLETANTSDAWVSVCHTVLLGVRVYGALVWLVCHASRTYQKRCSASLMSSRLPLLDALSSAVFSVVLPVAVLLLLS